MSDLTGRRVLVLEDLFYLAMDVRSILQKAGADVIGPFATAKEAMSGLEQQSPDCALLDVNLGEGASFDVARALRTRGTPFVFFTGYDASALPPEFADVPRLEKPVDARRLERVIKDCCATPC